MSTPPVAPDQRRVPLATCRLQFNAGFGFNQAVEVASYLAELGVSDLYASPLFQSGPQSTHGYDVCGYDQINTAIGGMEGLERLSSALRERKLGLLLDMVPNHMGNDLSNCWWADVLEKGRASHYASWFDIDWESSVPGLRDKVLLPILEGPYGTVLESGKLKVAWDRTRLAVTYYDRRFPASPRSYGKVLEGITPALPDAGLRDKVRDLLRTTTALESADPGQGRGFKDVKAVLAKLHATSNEWRTSLERVLAELNGSPGTPGSFDALHSFLEAQHYRLAHWRIGPEVINYRRFFNVTELVSMRAEHKEVFEASHRLVAALIRRGQVMGLRIDHPDGLWNPRQYCERLQEAFGGSSRFFVVVEKILTGRELLPGDWPVDGTTGYDFLNVLNGLFVNGQNEAEFDRIYSAFTGEDPSFDAAVYSGKNKVLRRSFVSEVSRFGRQLEMLAAASRYTRDLTFPALHAAVAEMLLGFPVYRTYVTPDTAEVSGTDRAHVASAFQAATRRNSALGRACEFIRDLLTLVFPGDYDEAAKRGARDFVMRFQQVSGPVMAKGLEDTAFYNYNRLISLNEVGGDPGTFGVGVEPFHEHNRLKAEHWPHSLLATATHDTKRGEDVRARINVLSELPGEWREALERWTGLNAPLKSTVHGRPAPSANDEYFLYQTLLGAWPEDAHTDAGLENFRQRVSTYMLKAAKEAKAHTTWTDPDEAYEKALTRFVENVMRSAQSPFMADFLQLQRKVAWFGMLNSLSQVLLKLTCPGVPDLYQGTELWDFSLVDPDNRRPVDYTLRREMLRDLARQTHSVPAEAVVAELFRDWPSGRIKMFLIARLLAFRQAEHELFEKGAYVPLRASGPGRDHICAFARSDGKKAAVVIATRLAATLLAAQIEAPIGEGIWAGSTLVLGQICAEKTLRSVLTHQTITPQSGQLRVGEALKVLPVAVLTAG